MTTCSQVISGRAYPSIGESGNSIGNRTGNQAFDHTIHDTANDCVNTIVGSDSFCRDFSVHILKDITPCPHLLVLEYGRQLQVELAFRYQVDLPPAAFDGARFAVLRVLGEHYYIHRHAAEEDRAWRFLLSCGLTRGRMGVLTATGEKAFHFLLTHIPRLQAAGWEVEGLERLRHFRLHRTSPRLLAHVSTLPAVNPRGSASPRTGPPERHADPQPAGEESAPRPRRTLFQLDLTLELEGERLPFQSVNRFLQSGESLLPLPTGEYVRISEPLIGLLQAITTLGTQRGEDQRIVDRAGLLWLKTLFEQASRLEQETGQVMGRPEAGGHQLTGDTHWTQLVQRLSWLEQAARGQLSGRVATPQGFAGTLRPYQEQGLAWLLALRDADLGGILADDMGLGKTIQLLSLLVYELQEKRAGTTLVIAPTSVVENWAAEAARFAPALRTVVLQGSSRRRRETALASAHLVITSYALVRRDLDWLLPLTFQRIVLDEAQYIKNHQSQTARAIRRLRALHRLTLTGTPIENRLEELWSQFAFLMPDLLGSLDSFKLRYVLPIEQGLAIPSPLPVGFKAGKQISDKGSGNAAEGDTPNAASGIETGLEVLPRSPARPPGTSLAPSTHQQVSLQRQQELAWRVGPYILRRLKGEVAQELPSRTELIVHCSLKPGQKAIYNALLLDSRDQLMAQVAQQGVMASRFTVLVTLLRLRQVCCDPMLLRDVDLPPRAQAALTHWLQTGEVSAKVELLLEQLTLLLQGGHRVLVFSQFVRMLEILQQVLQTHRIPYEYLDGHTVDRLARVERFNASETPVFLLSLKAGGTGLNLTGADYVIHFDPWWNPAVEAQATDRTHRIGQTRPVFSYKLIASGTVEERLLGLQARKRALAEGVLAQEVIAQAMMARGQSLLRSLTVEDLAWLLEVATDHASSQDN